MRLKTQRARSAGRGAQDREADDPEGERVTIPRVRLGTEAFRFGSSRGKGGR